MTQRIQNMTYDAEADAAYIKLVETPDDERLRTLPIKEKGINLDFNSADELVGIECLRASTVLPERLIERAQPIEEAIDDLDAELDDLLGGGE